MKKFKLSTREIGTVAVFDLEGIPSLEEMDDVSFRIQRNIRRHRLQRVILNLQGVPSLDQLGLRKLMAAFIRPQRSLIFGATGSVIHSLEETYVPKNVRICPTEKEVAEDFGPFLLEKEDEKRVRTEFDIAPQETIGYQVERRRAKRMHVAIPLELQIFVGNERVSATAIATNIGEGGAFAEYLDLRKAEMIDQIHGLAGLAVEVVIFPSANFAQEFRVKGTVIRKELHKKQLGVAVKFNETAPLL
ncbi:MAG: PilZ domain-containing protein [Candidatus Omnitrophica bacterium]|nr:PilZ domain-containing protein [Candidatus Omnitrophota bacterium]